MRYGIEAIAAEKRDAFWRVLVFTRNVRRVCVGFIAVCAALLGLPRGAVAAGPEQDRLTSATAPVGTAESPYLSAVIAAPATTGSWKRQEITAPMLRPDEARPKIDGLIDDPCWSRAAHVVGFFRFGTTAPVVEQTEAWILCDSNRLYLAFHCLDSHPGLIRARQIQRNGDMTDDDYVGVAIDSQNSHRNVSSFQVSARATQSEQIEGGTADNITWVGDWKAATRRTADGWTCEMAIPFRLLRYGKGASTFGLMLFRHVARETSRETWPDFPADGVNQPAQYLGYLSGLHPPTSAPRPVFLPYVLATGGAGKGAGSSLREGLDVKYPITTTLTGVATIFPDFKTVEQDVTDISFSYNEKYLPDRRPFFAEGSDYLPYRDMFYSRRIGQIDSGLKVVGKDNNLSVGLLAINSGWRTADPNQKQQVYVANLGRDFGPYSTITGMFTQDHQGETKVVDNSTAKLEYHWGTLAPLGYHPNVIVNTLPTWEDGKERGSKTFFHLGLGAPKGRPNTGINYESIPENFVSALGYNPEINHRGAEAWIEQYNDFDRGAVETYYAGVYAARYRHVHPDTFFNDHYSPEVFVGLRSGWGLDVSYNQARRDTYRDHTADYDLAWNRKSLFQRGGMHLTLGQVADERYRYANINQSFLIARPVTCQIQQNLLHQGAVFQTQTILTGTYRLSDARSLGTRIVRQTGSPDPKSENFVPPGTNLYFSYGQHVRSGYDLFVLVGDPNSPATRGVLTMKVIQPF